MAATVPFLQKEKKLTLKAKAVSQLRNAIISGTIVPGTRLVEQELSQMMGISRLPIREAIGNLEQAGLVTVLPYKGAFVSSFGIKEIYELFEIRGLLERHALKRLMQKDSTVALHELYKIVDDMRHIQDTDCNIEQSDFAFHSALCKHAENQVLYDTWAVLSTKTQTLFALVGNYTTSQDIELRHNELCQLIEKGDFELAAQGLEAHLRLGQSYVLKKLNLPA